ncbi:alanine/glycine:cation symporter family protein [Clostridium sp. Marseille-P2415]|uniref:alanine/glycine:cation symporter family protein n=1 Tax=Clostridium sp. Marseille-P2415 TaxID=1805471 RepID=UPI00098841BD|nr:sodium:alanine symporter family protein [Clostridium sp. Marseille-P2415]
MIHSIHELVWGPWLLVLFLGIGIIYTVKSGFFQVRKLPYWWKQTIGSIHEDAEEDKGEVTKFQTACTALAATIGTGNIVGVATALTAGGPGAIFWMWVSAVIGMMTGYAETMLGIRYRYRDKNGAWICGPMVYLEHGLKLPGLGMLYSFFCIMVSLGMGSMVQSNSIAETLEYTFGLPSVPIGVLLTGIVFLVVLGGIGRIAFVSERLIPLSAGIYMLFSMVVIMSCYDRIPYIFQCIFQDAFRPVSVFSGAAGYGISRSLQYGVSRGVFSHEAGLGSMAVLHGAAEDTTPEKQGMWAMFEVFFDTILICTMTAFVILCMTEGDAAGSGYDGAALTAYCFSRRLGALGQFVVSGAMLVFAFATIIAWYYLGRQAAVYLAESLKKRNALSLLQRILRGKVYTFLYLGAVFLGCLAKLETVWELSDIWNGLMAIPNITALIFLMKEVTFPE